VGTLCQRLVWTLAFERLVSALAVSQALRRRPDGGPFRMDV